jgi:ABC-2 type transport system permease protein
MFWKIFIFEVQNRLRRPAVYIYFLAAFVFIAFSFTTGALPVGEKEHINSPRLIAFAMGWISIIMMLVTSAIMGSPLYKDIEYNTKDYYLTYPISKFGYYWGRYFSSLLFILAIGAAVILGAFAGTKLGPLLGLNDFSRYGPDHLKYFLEPFVFIGIPNLVFTSSIFYGLVAITRNIKVIYSSGIILFLGYLIASFFLVRTNNQEVINLADPFAFTGIRMQYQDLNDQLRNVTLMTYHGSLLVNRIFWPGIGITLLVFSYLKFNFEDFFSGKRDKSSAIAVKPDRNTVRPQVSVSFDRRYNLRSLINLAKTELLNIVRDNYFWIIISCGLLFLGFVFYMGYDNNYGVPNFPRTVAILETFNETFLFFIFFVIIFYTGETVHRDGVTRYALINDSLPMSNWVLNGSKLLSLLVLAFGLSLIPVFLGIFVQLIKGYTQLNLPTYFMAVFTLILPRFLEMVVFAYMVHVVVNNKFAAHGIGITIWVLLYFMDTTSIFNYRPLLYSYTPGYELTDMNGIGHMASAVAWFNLYWLLAAGILVVIAALFYYRGTASSFKERLKLVKERFDVKTRLISGVLLIAFLSVASFVYYNVSYLNNYLTSSEMDQRAVSYERTLKRYDRLPLPKVKAMKLKVDLFPYQQRAVTHGFITLVNESTQPIAEMLVDADGITQYNLKTTGENIPFTAPLIFPRGKLNIFRSRADTSDFRLYRLIKPLAPGDSLIIELNSSVFYQGFSNDLYSADILDNGTFYKGGLPSLGYDEDDELSSPYERKKYHLPPKINEEIKQDDPEGINMLRASKPSMLFKFDLIVSTAADQIAVAPGELRKQWKSNGRSYFHYVQNNPGMYPPFAISSARYNISHDSVKIQNGKNVAINIYYDPKHIANISRFKKAYRDGLRYYSVAYGDYPFKTISLNETNGPKSFSAASFDAYNERFGWNAAFQNPDQQDYCYLVTGQLLAQQWWRFQVAPNNTVGSSVISEGLAQYDSYVMMEKIIGKNNMRGILESQSWDYLYRHSHSENAEHPILSANEWYTVQNKAGIVLYGLRDLIGEKNINAALSEFRNEYGFKEKPPYAGSSDLYRYLKMNTPDSLQYYLNDTWEKITFYNNRIISSSVLPLGKDNYKVTVKLHTEKTYLNGKGNYVTAPMSDYIDLAIFADPYKDNAGRTQVKPLYINKHKFNSGEHTIVLFVKGKPASVGIDPYAKLIDQNPNDNLKNIAQ